MVTLSIVVNTEPRKRRELLSTCRLIADQTRREEGCMEFCTTLDIEDENTIRVEQRWEHRSCMENHFHSDLFSALIGAVQVLGVSHEIRINESVRTEGMEAVNTAKSTTAAENG